jgi:KUP system potassium uptake protein
MTNNKRNFSFKENLKAMGLVFGDIGTSPIYTLTVIFTLTAPTAENIMGVLSLIFWTLIFLVTIEYAWLAMSLSTKGEGGIIVLKEIITSKLKTGRKIAFATFLGYIGVSLLMGDGAITPAISILSAVEGLELIPGLGHIETNTVIIITCIITILLFSVQSRGTDKVSASFGPIMILWFLSLFTSGIISIINNVPGVLLAVSPHYAINFMIDNGITGFFVLSEVILCATGGEALYADMGHLGSKPIRQAWYFVFVALVVNYFGQGAFLMSEPHPTFVLFAMVKSISEFAYVPFLILTLLATIIASQAMISAMMALIYQGINTRIFPLMKVTHTSKELKSQIYIGVVNWLLLMAVILMIFIFRRSENLAAAYGMAVTATMTISAIFMIWIFKHDKDFLKFSISIIVLLADLVFLVAVINKFPDGGYWSVVIAAIPFILIVLWSMGNSVMARVFRSLPLDVFLESYNQLYSLGNNIKGTAVFLTKKMDMIPPYMVHCIIRTNIIYEENILLSITTMDQPYGLQIHKIGKIAPGLWGLRINSGYMEIIDIPQVLRDNKISEKVMFYGIEQISARNPLLKVYTFLKKISPEFVAFYKLTDRKLHGVATRLRV